MDLTENPWFKFSERMELDFCRELAVQHKILLQEAGSFPGASCFLACGVCCITFLFFVGVCCSCCCCCFFFFSKIFFRWVLFCLYVVKTNWVVKVKGLKGILYLYLFIYIYPTLLLGFHRFFWMLLASRDQRSFRWQVDAFYTRPVPARWGVKITLKGIDVWRGWGESFLGDVQHKEVSDNLKWSQKLQE